MHRKLLTLGLSSLLLAAWSPVAGQQADVTFGGQVRPRIETRTPVEGSSDTFTSMRVRASLQALLEGNLRVFIQLQDVRFFGEEGNTLTDYRADNLDLHQGYLEWSSVPMVGGAARVGRQEMAFGEQRLIGAVDWSQQGRSFDGIRYTTPSLGPLKADLFAMKLGDATAPAHEEDAALVGGYGTLSLEDAGSLDLFALATTQSGAASTDEVTLGALWRGTAGPFDLRFEGAWQTGERSGQDVSAFMLAGWAGLTVARGTALTLWYDYLSGDDNPDDGKTRVFNTLFATNHAFYGFADYFTNIPLHTGGLGLRDAAVKLAHTLAPRTTLRVDLHTFQTARDGELTTQALADELDLTLSHTLTSAFSMMGGYSFVRSRDGIEELGRLEENAHWAYLMLNAHF